MNYIVYDDKGYILRWGTCPPEGFDLQKGDGEFILEGVCTVYDYVLNNEVVRRPEMNLEVRGSILSEVPNGSSVYIDSNYVGDCVNGIIRIEKEDDSVYKIKLKCFPYLDYEVEL